jgi:hypothetical protein
MRLLNAHEARTELLCVMSWSEDAARAFRKALNDWHRAGCPAIPLGARDYRRTFRRARKARETAR